MPSSTRRSTVILIGSVLILVIGMVGVLNMLIRTSWDFLVTPPILAQSDGGGGEDPPPDDPPPDDPPPDDGGGGDGGGSDGGGGGNGDGGGGSEVTPTPSKKSSPTPKAASPSPSPSPQPSPVPSPLPTRRAVTTSISAASPSPSAGPSFLPSPTPSPTPTPIVVVAAAATPPPRVASSLTAAARPVAHIVEVALAVVGIAAVASTASAAVSALSNTWSSLGHTFLPFLAVRRRSLPWGRVVEEGTNHPLAGTIITVFDNAKRAVATARARADGTFGVLLSPGTYRLVASRPGYELAGGAARAALFPGETLYTGQAVALSREGLVSSLVIPLQAERAKRAHVTSAWTELTYHWRLWQNRWAPRLLLIGAAVIGVHLSLAPSWLLLGLAVVYALLLAAEIGISRLLHQAVGRVFDQLSRQPIGLALVRLLDAETRRVVATEVTTPKGQFLLMPPPGTYQLQVVHSDYRPLVQENIRPSRIVSGVVRAEVPLKRKE